MVEKRVEQNLRTSQSAAEDSINVEFLEWLKKWGPNIIIAVALVVILFQGSQWWMQRIEDKQSVAWADLANTNNVAGLLAVADEKRGIGSVSELAWMKAAQQHYQTIILDKPLEIDALSGSDDGDALSGDGKGDTSETADGVTDSAEEDSGADSAADETKERPTHLSAEDRADLLAKMSQLYQRVIESTKDDPDKDVLQIQATYGMAMVAEMQLDLDSARASYERVRSLCEGKYPKMAKLAEARIADADRDVKPIEILSNDEVKKIEESTTVPELLERPEEAPAGDANGEEGGAKEEDNAAGTETKTEAGGDGNATTKEGDSAKKNDESAADEKEKDDGVGGGG